MMRPARRAGAAEAAEAAEAAGNATTHQGFAQMKRVTYLLLGVSLAACGKKAKPAESNAADNASWVGKENVVVVNQQNLSVGPTVSGTLEAERKAVVRAEIGATVVAINAEAGQAVARGAVLARLDDASIRDAFESSKSALTSAELSEQISGRELERAKALVEAGAVAERDVETARLAQTAASAQLADMKSRLSSAQKQLERTVLRAPFSGVVSERPVSLGDVVQSGNTMFTIIDPASLKFEGTVPAEAIANLKVGTPVSFTVAGFGSLEGKVTRVNPSVDPVTRQVRLTVGVPNQAGKLLAGLFAEGRVATSTRSGVVVPSNAVDRRGIRPFVVRIKSGKVERVEVELGLVDETKEEMEVRTGLVSGDTLLVGGARGLAPGTVVRIGSPAEITGGQAATLPAKE
jgi:membrane fusion protein, multidrug efflux system